MQFEWDPAKAERVMSERAIAFADVAGLFDFAHVIVPSNKGEETRWRVIGEIDEVCVTGIYTVRGDVIRIITARRAWPKEEREYRALHAR